MLNPGQRRNHAHGRLPNLRNATVAEKVVVKNLYKVYGANPALAMQMLQQGTARKPSSSRPA